MRKSQGKRANMGKTSISLTRVGHALILLGPLLFVSC